MIPRRPLFILTGVLAALGFVVAFGLAPATYWWVAGGVVGFATLVDLAVSRIAVVPSVERKVAGSMSLSSWSNVELNVRNTSTKQRLRARVFDHHPESFSVEGQPRDIDVRPGHFVDLEYRVRPTRRGAYNFPGVQLRIASPLGLWWRLRLHSSAH